MPMRTAIIGDVHGCLAELVELCALLRADGVHRIFHLGDLVDRGPDSAGVVKYCRENRIQGIMGNHESSLLALNEKVRSHYFDPRTLTPDKQIRVKILQAMKREDIAYLKLLPKLHALDEFNTVLVHGGLWPNRSLWHQDRSILYLQVIHPDRPGDVRWTSREGSYTLAQSRAEGFAPWQELYNGNEQVVYGHSVFEEPNIHGNTIGIDTGCVYGGKLTALVLPEKKFISVKAKAAYVERRADDSY